jgi:PAS domain S-box-containing protein
MNAEQELKLLRQVADLESQLAEAQAVLRAIYNREVDAVVVHGADGEQVFTLQAAERPYRVMMETMSEGAVTLSQDGAVLHCNRAFAQLLGRPLAELIGSRFAAWVTDEHQASYAELLQSSTEPRRSDLSLVKADGGTLPVQLASSPLKLEDLPGAICVIVLDLSEQQRRLALEIEQQAGQAREQALRQRQEELEKLNQELEDINRGMVSLYAELDDKAKELKRADELKTRFLSNMSHEFRTPLNSIFALSRLLLDRADGELTSEQEKQVGFIRKAADSLLELVNDLLDLAKIRAGKTDVHPVEFEAVNLFSALRGTLRSLAVNQAVKLVFEEPEGLPLLYTDEGKVAQILRNFISNALKFTERGEVRVSAQYNKRGMVTFTVSDTGMGIAPQDQGRIFEEFTQLENPAQSQFKGTGLGLPLCYKLADLLGGRIELTSEVGVGSKFSVTLPARYQSASAVRSVDETESRWEVEAGRIPVLVLEGEAETRMLYEKYLHGTPYQVIAVGNIAQARRALRWARPRAIVLDPTQDAEAWNWTLELDNEPATREIPVLVATAAQRERAGVRPHANLVKPVERERLLAALERVTLGDGGAEFNQPPAWPRWHILIIDDEPAARYVMASFFKDQSCVTYEARNGTDGIRMTREIKPQLVLLDLHMPDMSGYDVLDSLKADSEMHRIPVAVVTSASLSDEQRRKLQGQTCAIINKGALSRERMSRLVELVRRQAQRVDGVREARAE